MDYLERAYHNGPFDDPYEYSDSDVAGPVFGSRQTASGSADAPAPREAANQAGGSPRASSGLAGGSFVADNPEVAGAAVLLVVAVVTPLVLKATDWMVERVHRHMRNRADSRTAG